MGKTTQIAWTDATFSPWRGCTKVSDGCKFCYADASYGAKIKGKTGLPIWGPTAAREAAAESYWNEPKKWLRDWKEERRMRIFCASLADVFEGPETCQDPAAWKVVTEGRKRLFGLIEDTPEIDWQLLTKRPERIMEYVPDGWTRQFPDNVWMGTSIEDQRVVGRAAELCAVPAVVRWLSVEPLIGPLDLSGYPALDWIVVGGESGENARPMHPDWARSLRDAARLAEVAFFMKQWGEWAPAEPISGSDEKALLFSGYPPFNRRGVAAGSLTNHLVPWAGDVWMRRVGKKAAGHLLDGVEWHQFPTPRGGAKERLANATARLAHEHGQSPRPFGGLMP